MSVVEVKDFWFKYRGGNSWVLKGLSFSVEKGETVVVMGPSGCGKSTLLYALVGVIPHVIRGEVKGSIRVLGRDTLSHRPEDLMRDVGFVFQNPEIQTIMPTVIEELVFGLENLGLSREEIEKRVEDVLEFTGFKGREREPISSLSLGEKQALAIASVLAMRPKLLILDEPTSMLDHPGTVRVLNLVEKLKREQELTLIIVEHRIEWIVEHADRVIIMEDGAIVVDGPPREVFSNKEVVMKTGVRPPQVSEIFYGVSDVVKRVPTTLSEALELLEGYGRPLLSSEREETGEAERGEVVVEVEDVWFKYRAEGPWVLRGVSLKAYSGEVLALIGHSGAGKTTLIKHLNGLLKPMSGSVRVCGLDSRRVPSSRLSRLVGVVFQNPEAQFFASTILDEMSFALRAAGLPEREVRSRIEEALKTVDLEKPLETSPHTLSFGEKHRLAIASILALKPKILALDEPFSGLDYKRSLLLLESLRRFVDAGGTVILVAHDLQLISEVADRVAVLEEGRIARVGPVEEVLSDTSWLRDHGFIPLQSALLAEKIGARGAVRTRDLAKILEKLVARGKAGGGHGG